MIKLIMNPGSRAGRARQRWPYWLEALKNSGVEHTALITQSRRNAYELALASSPGDTVVAVGGDGTINEVINGLVDAPSREMKMGVLYNGTSPDFCRFHGIPTDPREAMKILLHAAARPVDVARIRYHDGAGTDITRHFACSTNIGLGSAVAECSNRIRPFFGDTTGTAFALIKAVLKLRPCDYRFTINQRSIALSDVCHVAVLKNPYIASGLKADLPLTPDDGKLCVVALHDMSRMKLLRLLPRLYSGDVTGRPGVFTATAQDIHISATSPRTVEYDGDPQGFLPAEVSLLPRHLNLIGSCT